MVSEQEIREDGLTTDDVLDREVVEPQQEVRILPEWDHEAEAPGKNVHIDGDELVWERDGFEARLRSHETTHWKAELSIPREYGKYHPRPVDLKCSPLPKHGFVETVETDGYVSVGATLVIVENYQPTYQVNKFIDKLIDDAAGAEAFTDDLESKLSVARDNEEEQKQARTPGWSDDHDAFVCPHCKETSTSVSVRDDGGSDCIHCGESVDEYVVSESEADE